MLYSNRENGDHERGRVCSDSASSSAEPFSGWYSAGSTSRRTRFMAGELYKSSGQDLGGLGQSSSDVGAQMIQWGTRAGPHDLVMRRMRTP